MLGLQNKREWKIYCQAVLERPALAVDPRYGSNVRRVANRDALTALIVVSFAGLTAAEIANARVNDMNELCAHRQLAARWLAIGLPAGPLPALLPPAGTYAFWPHMDSTPALHEHTDAILGELGYSGSDVEGLRTAVPSEAFGRQ
jgi:itaconate CoA-transferase